MASSTSQAITVRLDADLVRWVDSQGEGRRSVLESAIRALRGGAPPAANVEPDVVPSPQQTGTAHWRDPSPEEVEDSRVRYAREYPDREPLSRERLLRLARADGKARDQGRLPPLGTPHGRGDFAVAGPDGLPSRERGARESSFEQATQARVDLFMNLRTPDSAKGIKPKEGGS